MMCGAGRSMGRRPSVATGPWSSQRLSERIDDASQQAVALDGHVDLPCPCARLHARVQAPVSSAAHPDFVLVHVEAMPNTSRELQQLWSPRGRLETRANTRWKHCHRSRPRAAYPRHDGFGAPANAFERRSNASRRISGVLVIGLSGRRRIVLGRWRLYQVLSCFRGTKAGCDAPGDFPPVRGQSIPPITSGHVV